MHFETLRFLVIFLCDSGAVMITTLLVSQDIIASIIFTIVLILTGYFLGAYDFLHRPSFGLRLTTQVILFFTFVFSVLAKRITGYPLDFIYHNVFWFYIWVLLNLLLVPINIALCNLFPISAVLVGRKHYHRYRRIANLLGFKIIDSVPMVHIGYWLNAHSDEFGRLHNVEAVIFTPVPKSRLTWVKTLAERYFTQFIVFRSGSPLTYLIGLLFLTISASPLSGIHMRIKRVVDFTAVVAILLFIWPLFIFIALLILIDSKGPVFFIHNRIGKGLNYFRLYKFRTMFKDAESRLREFLESDPKIREEFLKSFKLRNDPRVTKIGSMLRKWSLDELPQLINVLKGEMSLVGYRPIITDEIGIYKKQSLIVFRTPPGITGQWQTSGRSDTTYLERVKLDIDYIRDWSYLKDLKILLKTIPTVLKRKGAY